MTWHYFSVPVINIDLPRVPLCSGRSQFHQIYCEARQKGNTEPTFYPSEAAHLHCDGSVLCCVVSLILVYVSDCIVEGAVRLIKSKLFSAERWPERPRHLPFKSGYSGYSRVPGNFFDLPGNFRKILLFQKILVVNPKSQRHEPVKIKSVDFPSKW